MFLSMGTVKYKFHVNSVREAHTLLSLIVGGSDTIKVD